MLQEFYYCNPHVKFYLNNIYNTHFTGSELWNLFGPEMDKIVKTWNVSCRKIFNIPLNTHKFLIEPITGSQHLKFKLLKKFLKFIYNVKSHSKNIVRNLYSVICNDTNSITGSNLRNLMILVNSSSVNNISCKQIDSLIFFTV